MWRYLYTGDVWKLMTHQLNPMVRMLFMDVSIKVSVRGCVFGSVCVCVCYYVHCVCTNMPSTEENLIYFHHIAPSKHPPALPDLTPAVVNMPKLHNGDPMKITLMR